MQVIKRDGRREPISVEKIHKVTTWACEGLNVSQSELETEAHLMFFDGIKTADIQDALVKAAATLVSVASPDFTFVAARLLLQKLYKEVDGSINYGHISWYIKRGVVENRLNPDLLNFDLDMLNSAIVQDRDLQFTYLGLQTIADRYLIRAQRTDQENDSKIIELPQFFWMRVAMGLALNEADRNARAIEFYNVLSKMEFVSSTPTLFNSGTLHSQLSSCFPPETEIATADGFRQIKDVKVGDRVLTQGGTFESVLATRAKPAESDFVRVWVRGVLNNNDPLLTPTADHRIFVFKTGALAPDWHRADSLEVGDAVQIGFPTSEDAEPLRVADVVSDAYVVADGRVYKTKNDIKRGFVNGLSIQTSPVTNCIPWTAEFGRFMGYYLAEGHVSDGNLVCFTFNSKDSAYIADAVELGLSVFGLSGTVRVNKDGSTNVRFHSRILSSFVMSLVGTHFDQKRLPECFMSAPKAFVRGILVGVMRGDGCALPYGMSFQLSNRELTLQLFQLLLKLGYLPNVSMAHKGRLATVQPYCVTLRYADAADLIDEIDKNLHRITNRAVGRGVDKRRFFHEGLAFYKIYELRETPAQSEVFDLEVANDPSFIAGMTVVHNCYLNTVADQISAEPGDHRFASIFGALEECANLSKYAGGIGTDWTRVRSAGDVIKGTNGKSSGVVPYLKVFNDTAVAVNQGGKRQGSFAAYLEPWHPDLYDFIDLKKNSGDERRRAHDIFPALWVPDLFFQRVQEQGDWSFFSPKDYPELHELYGAAFEKRYTQLESEGKERFKRPAMEVWKRILTSLFETGHPWITMKDECNRRNPQSHVGVIHSSNLCTEITLNTSDEETAVCNLGSINLSRVNKAEDLKRVVKTAIRMLDNVIDLNFYPSDRAEHSNMRHRPIGLGVMGYTEWLVQENIDWESDRHLRMADRLFEHISYYAIEASSDLAVERGAYPSFRGSKWSLGELPILNARNQEYVLDWRGLSAKVVVQGMRNSNLMAIAPTATIANICGTTPCIEPIFERKYTKSNLSGSFIVVDPCLKYGRLDLCKEAFEIDSLWIIKAAAKRQKWIDQSQSVNIFVRNDIRGSELAEIYMTAWQLGLKTTYYLRSQSAQLKTVGPQPIESETNFCSIDNPDCEACQ